MKLINILCLLIKSSNILVCSAVQKTKNILFWNSFFEFSDWKRDRWYPVFKAECPVNNCHFTNDRNYLKSTGDFDAVLFHSFNLPWLTNDLPDPGTRVDRQIYVFFSHESPVMDGQEIGKYNGYFNWTMTYRLDSDIHLPYAFIRAINKSSESIANMSLYPLDWSRERRPPTNIPAILSTDAPYPVPPSSGMKDDPPTQIMDDPVAPTKSSSKRLVSWVVSKCLTPSDRGAYVGKLEKLVPVDIYGGCNSRPCNRSCYTDLLSTSQFYLSLENSICRDYVTEKFWNALIHHTVPVVDSDGSHALVAPPGSYINIKDFPTPAALAEYLLLLDQNSTLYNQYLWWTEYYTVMKNESQLYAKAMCNLCTKLDNPGYKVYTRLDDWWEYNKCTVAVHNMDWFSFTKRFLLLLALQIDGINLTRTLVTIAVIVVLHTGRKWYKVKSSVK